MESKRHGIKQTLDQTGMESNGDQTDNGIKDLSTIFRSKILHPKMHHPKIFNPEIDFTKTARSKIDQPHAKIFQQIFKYKRITPPD